MTDVQEQTKPAEAGALDEFLAALTYIVEHRDRNTGALARESAVAVQKIYRDLPDIKTRTLAKKEVQARLRAAIKAADITSSQALVAVGDLLSASGPGAGVDKLPPDPVTEFRARLAAAHIAYTMVLEEAPEGVDTDKVLADVGALVERIGDQAQQYVKWLSLDPASRGEKPDVRPEVELAGKMAYVDSKTRATKRTNIVEHIIQAFGDVAPGTFMSAKEIASVRTSECPSGSNGSSVLYRLFPTTDREIPAKLLAVVTPSTDAHGNRGAVKR